MAISKEILQLYDQFDDGLGGSYERIALFRVIDCWARKHQVKRILELNATFICGVPAFSSFLFAKAGYEVTIMVHHRDYQDALRIWKKADFGGKVEIVEGNNDLKTPFKNGSFDLVWNHLVVEQYDNPDPLQLIREMKRVSGKLVWTSTLNPHGLGYWLHRLAHKFQKKPWDHGSLKYSLIGPLKEIYKQAGLEVIGTGGVDCPPWLDTGDSQVQGSMTYIKNAIGKRWLWCLLDPDLPNRFLIRLLWELEEALPRWFKILNAHHLYVIGKKELVENETR